MSGPKIERERAAGAPAATDDASARRRQRSLKTPITLVVAAAVSLLGFALFIPHDAATTVDFGSGLAPVAVPTFATNLVISIALAAAAAYSFRSAPSRWLIGVFATLWLVALILAVGAGATVPLTWLLTGSLALATPLIYGSMAGVVSERSGVVNIAIEGQLLAGAFTAALVASMTGSPYLGLLGAIVAGVAVSVVLAVFSVRFFVEQVVVGVVINLLVVGLTNFLFSGVMSRDPALYNQPPKFPVWSIPLLSDIPVIGPLFFQNSIVTYLMFALVPFLTWALFRTRWGLRMRAVGEHPQAADTLGIDVNRTRFLNVLLSGVIAGIGGSFFSIGSVGAFSREMTSGQGYIALAALIFGRWHPVYATFAALLFGFASNLKTLASQVGANIPPEFMSMIPYIVTILAVAGFVGRSRAPAADGTPYRKE